MKKTHHKKQVADAVSRKFERLRSKPPEQRTGAENLRALMGIETIELIECEKSEEELEQKIILYLREGVNPASKNFTKYPNEIHEVMNARLNEMSSGIVYTYLWRQSWGYGRNYCRISYATIVNNTLVKSRSTAQRAIYTLQELHFIVRSLLENGDPDVDQAGALYRIITPNEIINGKTEEGVLLEDIPIEGVLMISIPIKGISTIGIDNKTENSLNISNKKINTDNQCNDSGYTNGEYTNNKHTDSDYNPLPIKGIPIKDIPLQNPVTKPIIQNYTDKRYTDNKYTFKEDNLKDSLSQEEIIDHFYNCIGQKDITRKKRERANNCLQGLLNEGYSLEDIKFAAEWTVKNIEKKLYDFSIIEHTINQAMSEKEGIEKREAEKLEKGRLAEEEKEEQERLEKESQEMESYKENMDQNERERLKSLALAELRDDPKIREEFISDTLIRIKENEILKKGFGKI
ncbi:hypothetical protein JW766_04115 [Candidatus Dojkabacteria bacterium]|nr:hypothetical protein [Candidatus Dojkabacteria bacterium]